jgi:hypothetical protein
MRNAGKLLLAIVVLGSSARSVWAGEVKLVSDTWDNICKVEVKSGPNAPEQGSPESYSNVPRNWYVTHADRICYRRSANPTDCASGWTDWRCDTEMLDQTDIFSLQ